MDRVPIHSRRTGPNRKSGSRTGRRTACSHHSRFNPRSCPTPDCSYTAAPNKRFLFRTQPLEPKSCVNHRFSLHSIVSNGLSNRTGCSHPTAHPQRCRTHLHVYRPLADMVVEPYGFGIHARFSRFVPPRRRQRTDHRASHRLARPCSIFRV